MLNGDLLLITLSSETIELNLWYIILHCFANGLAFARLRWLGRNRELYHHVDDDNDNLKKEKKKQLFLWAKQQLCTCLLFSRFPWRPWNDYNVKPGGREHRTTNFPFSFLNWINSSRNQLQEKSPIFDKLGSLSYDDGENGKKASDFDRQNSNSARPSPFFVHFFAVTARLRHKNA